MKKSRKMNKLSFLFTVFALLIVISCSTTQKVPNRETDVKESLSVRYRFLSNDPPILDLAVYENTEFKDLPPLRPSIFQYSKSKKDRGNMWSFYNETFFAYRSRVAIYQGIFYEIGVGHYRDKPLDAYLPVEVIQTYDPDFECFGYKVGDYIDDDSLEWKRYKGSMFIHMIPPENSWAIHVRNNRVAGFWRADYDGMTIDSVMKSNRVPAEPR